VISWEIPEDHIAEEFTTMRRSTGIIQHVQHSTSHCPAMSPSYSRKLTIYENPKQLQYIKRSTTPLAMDLNGQQEPIN